MGMSDNKYSHLENELSIIGRELEAVRMSNEGLLETGHCYKQELHALQNHADILALQNNDLQKELDEFVMTDDMIKNSLDRKGRVASIKARVEDTIHQSEIQVETLRLLAIGILILLLADFNGVTNVRKFVNSVLFTASLSPAIEDQSCSNPSSVNPGILNSRRCSSKSLCNFSLVIPSSSEIIHKL